MDSEEEKAQFYSLPTTLYQKIVLRRRRLTDTLPGHLSRIGE
jgi:hypothetical protein